MPKKYFLISEPTGVSAEALGNAVGMRAFDTPLGTLLEKPEPFDLEDAMRKINRVLNPDACTCGAYAIIHRPNCPAWNCIS